MKPVREIIGPQICREKIKLVPVGTEHYPALHHWMADSSSLFLWTNQLYIDSKESFRERFEQKLRSYYHSFFMIQNGDKDQPTGFTYSFDFNPIDGFIFFTTFIDQDHRERKVATNSNILFFDYLFSYFPLRKIYTDIYSYNIPSFTAMQKSSAHIEGEFQKHRFFRGEYHSLFRFAIYREEFYGQVRERDEMDLEMRLKINDPKIGADQTI